MYLPRQTKFFTVCVSFLNVAVIHFISPLSLKIIVKTTLSRLSGTQALHRSGRGEATSLQERDPSRRLSPQILTFPVGSAAKLPIAGHPKTTGSTQEDPTAVHPTLGGAWFPGTGSARGARSRPARLLGRGQQLFSALPAVANEAGSDAHAHTRPPRTWVQRMRPLKSNSLCSLRSSFQFRPHGGGDKQEHEVVSRGCHLPWPRIPPPGPWTRVPHPLAAEPSYGTSATRTHRGDMGARGRDEGLR